MRGECLGKGNTTVNVKEGEMESRKGGGWMGTKDRCTYR